MSTGASQPRWDTAPEVLVQQALHNEGLLDYTLQKTIRLPDWGKKRQWTTPDILFDEQKLAIFVDGCAWHGCPKHHVEFETNRPYWRRKHAIQRARDQRHSRCLETLGYRVVRIWECEDAEAGARAVRAVLDTDQPPGIYGLP